MRINDMQLSSNWWDTVWL